MGAKQLIPVKKSPAPHQGEALAAINSALTHTDRATVVMACGTGKTLLELWAAEATGAKRTIVLVPTLNLLQQVYHEWLEQNSWGPNFRALCVCSDAAVGRSEDQIELMPEDLDFPTCTRPGVVNEFLDALDEEEAAAGVIFCTYHSAAVVAQAMSVRREDDRSLGLGIFDEAHKTVGDSSRAFSFALQDANLQISKRLFFTATPRVIVGRRQRNEEGDLLVSSMDDEAVYGEHVYTLSFAEAARREIIVPFKVLISVVDDITITKEQIDAAVVRSDGEAFEATTLASQIAMRRAMDTYGLKKAITFHSTVESAEQFTRSAFLLGKSDFMTVESLHVSGYQRTAERHSVMSRFRNAERAAISNARCLTEGVDVPAVDIVAFMDPKSSKVDIVQAAGRAMRKAGPEKSFGYILLPLLLHSTDGETPSAVLEQSNFSTIAEVLEALAESDDSMQTILRSVAAGGTETLVSDVHAGGRVQIDLGGLSISGFDKTRLIRAIETRLLGELVSGYERFISEMQFYQREHGHCDVPQHYKTRSGYPLGIKCNKQRLYAKSDSYPANRRDELNRIGFRLSTTPPAAAFSELVTHLLDFKAEHGHLRIQRAYVSADGYPLGKRCHDHRKRERRHGYPATHRVELEAIGFEFWSRNVRSIAEDIFRVPVFNDRPR